MTSHLKYLILFLSLVGLCPIHARADIPAGSQAQRMAGQKIYMVSCFACHQANGQGMPDMFPPLASSDWVQAGKPDRVVRIVIHGMVGPLHINGEAFSSPAPLMPAQAHLTDQQVADVLTYIRSSWGNDAGAVSADQVSAIRKAEASRSTPWTEAELLGIAVD